MNGMPPVSRCSVTKCFYNKDSGCHAPAINVGSDHPACDTYLADTRHIGRKDTGMVGACHVKECQHNTDLMCSAQAIVVAEHSGHADCATYAKR